MSAIRIAITGGPSTGKTALIEQLEKEGHYCFHEIIRSMTSEAKKTIKGTLNASNPLAFVEDPFAFNLKILEGRTDQFIAANTGELSLAFYDRGIPDVLAYMDYFKQDYPLSFEKRCRQYTYDKVLVLPPWIDIFKKDDERMESYEEGIAIHEHLVATYSKFGYDLVSVPTGTIEERVDFINGILNPI